MILYKTNIFRPYLRCSVSYKATDPILRVARVNSKEEEKGENWSLFKVSLPLTSFMNILSRRTRDQSFKTFLEGIQVNLD